LTISSVFEIPSNLDQHKNPNKLLDISACRWHCSWILVTMNNTLAIFLLLFSQVFSPNCLEMWNFTCYWALIFN